MNDAGFGVRKSRKKPKNAGFLFKSQYHPYYMQNSQDKEPNIIDKWCDIDRSKARRLLVNITTNAWRTNRKHSALQLSVTGVRRRLITLSKGEKFGRSLESENFNQKTRKQQPINGMRSLKHFSEMARHHLQEALEYCNSTTGKLSPRYKTMWKEDLPRPPLSCRLVLELLQFSQLMYRSHERYQVIK